MLINNENVFTRIGVWAACHECPSSWVRCLSPESVERRTTPESGTITKKRKGFEVKNSSSPEQNGAAYKPRNTMLEDVDELMLAKPWCDHAESASSPLAETDIAGVHSVFDAQNFSLLLSRDEEIDVLAGIPVEERMTIHLQKDWQRQEYPKTSKTNRGEHSVSLCRW